MTYFSTHNHSSYSNLKGLDAILRLDEMIQYANDIDLKGICLSEHEFIGSHMKFLNEYKKLKKSGKIREDFKVGLGNEIYLVHEETLEELKENANNRNPMTKFYHFLLLARNLDGHKQIRELSSLAWENSFTLFGMERVPTFKSNLKRIIKKGDVIASTACAGSFVAQNIVRIHKEDDIDKKNYYIKLNDEFINFCIDVFGKEYFYLEIQPSNNEEQITINKELIKLSKQYELRYTIATDGHYLKREDRSAHRTYLQSQNAEREVDAFYEATFIQSEDEVKEYLSPYLTEDEIQSGFDGTIDIYNKIEEYSLERATIIPTPDIPEYEFSHDLEPAYEKYPYIKSFAYSEYPIDKYFLHLIQQGLIEKIIKKRSADKEYFHICLDRINTELREIWLISEKLHERVSAYYVLVAQIVDLMWTDGDSLVGVSRGSAGGYLTVYLLGIIQMNPLDYNLPHFRHLTAERPELPDIDLDSEQGKRSKILNALKMKYGYDKVLNIATFTTEGSRSALLSSARGMGIDVDEVGYLTSLIPVHRGFTWSLKDCFFGNGDDRQPVAELVNAVKKYDGLMENALKIEGLIKARSIHASGIYIFDNRYTELNAMMRASSGQPTTQFDMGDSDKMGALKVDALTVQAIDRIRNAFDSLIEFGYIKDLGSLRETYDESIHPDILEYKNEEMWEMVGNNEILDLFQFDTPVGLQCAKKIKPNSVEELAIANSIMRLMAEDGNEQPMDKFVRHKEEIQNWYDEMDKYEISEREREIISKHLAPAYGVTSSQEELMLIMMDENISNFSIQESNFARKIIGKKLMEKIPDVLELFFNKGEECGSSKNLLKYIWDTQIVPQLGYSFSNLHSTGYSLIALQEMNIAHKYPNIIWATACLSVSANASEEGEFVEDDTQKKVKATKYGKVASSIGKMSAYGVAVSLPCINNSRLEFSPDLKNNTILYGLKGIVGINDDVCHAIIDNRPYASYEDFYSRVYSEGLIQKKHMISLIKSGCFNSFDSPVNVMRQYVKSQVDVKESLNMQNFKSIIRLGLLDKPELNIYLQYYNFKDFISKNVVRTIAKPKEKIFGMDSYATNFYYQHFKGEAIVGESNGYVEVSEKKFKKEFDVLIQPVKDLINTEGFLRQYNEAQFMEIWFDIASGSVPKWEMDSVSYYASEHELANVNKNYYNIVDFMQLDTSPDIIGYNKFKGRETPKYQTHTLIGTILDKDKVKHSITILTPTGVVTCKLYAGAFAHYDKTISHFVNGKKETIEKPWFTRGNLVMVKGFRREDQFVLRTYASKGQQKEHTVALIKDIREDGSLVLQMERTRV